MKYHINKNGLAAVCKAKERPCPLGGDDVHFNTLEEAEAYIQLEHEVDYDLLPNSQDITLSVPDPIYPKFNVYDKVKLTAAEDMLLRAQWLPSGVMYRETLGSKFFNEVVSEADNQVFAESPLPTDTKAEIEENIINHLTAKEYGVNIPLDDYSTSGETANLLSKQKKEYADKYYESLNKKWVKTIDKYSEKLSKKAGISEDKAKAWIIKQVFN